MSSDDKISKDIQALEAKENDIQKKVQEYHRKLMKPVWEERRELVKQIPNFWAEAIGNSPIFSIQLDEQDIEALENLTDFHVEYDDARPNYRKVVATFKKNNIFKNEQLTKEFTLDDEEGTVISKSTIDYHPGKDTSKKRKSTEDEEDSGFALKFLEWFGDDSIHAGAVLTEEIFPDAFELYKGDSDDEDDEDDIELGSDSEEEEEAPKSKKSKK